jgi:beta-glucosidase
MESMTPAELLAQLTEAERIALTAGADAWTTTAVERLGIPALRLGDGPHGVRKPHEGSGMSMFDSHPATCFPTAAALGSTWDARLVQEVGEALGLESAAHDVDVLLGPGVNLKRTPVGGRNFEYFSEDPLVSARLGGAWVRGVQSTGVGASIKHFAANNTEQRRYGIDAVVDERALRELYFAAFEAVVRADSPASVMAAYNRLNGEHCTESHRLLTALLRDEWGFDGVVVSDWGASWDRTVSIPAGNDLTMPGLGAGDDEYVQRALRSGRLSRQALESSVLRILGLIEKYAHPPLDAGSGEPPDAPAPVDLDAHHLLARRAAAAGTVLLKNDGGLLPLHAGSTVALIGGMAADPRYQGAGSSHVVPTRVDTLLDALTAAVTAGGGTLVYEPGYRRHESTSTPERLAAAQRAAAGADAAVVVVGLPEVYETEGVDREHLRLPEWHDRLVEAVREANPNTVVVLQNGAPVELPWRDAVPAIVEGYLGGQAGGSALADVLLGEAEPGGRLAETFPARYADHPVAQLPDGPETSEYRESVYVGYRWFDSAGEPVAFPFGHGLSYTRFAWSDVTVEVHEGGREHEGVGAESVVTVALTVTNTGERAGSEVVQLYVNDVESTVYRPEQELRGFAKVELEPGASERVVLHLDRRAFSVWGVETGEWMLEAGGFEVRLGHSSRDIVWRSTIELDGIVMVAGRPEPDAYRSPSRETGFPIADFERVLGRRVPPNTAPRPGEYTLDTAVRDMQGTLVGRLLQRYLTREAVKTIGAPDLGPVDLVAGDVVSQLTFRMFPTVSDAGIGRRGAVRLLRLVNLLSRRPRLLGSRLLGSRLLGSRRLWSQLRRAFGRP